MGSPVDVFRPAGPAGFRSIHILVFAKFEHLERSKPIVFNEFHYEMKRVRFLMLRTITRLGAPSHPPKSGVSA